MYQSQKAKKKGQDLPQCDSSHFQPVIIHQSLFSNSLQYATIETLNHTSSLRLVKSSNQIRYFATVRVLLSDLYNYNR